MDNSTVNDSTPFQETNEQGQGQGLMTDETSHLFTLINYVILSGPISFFGLIFNVVNVIVFVKQGFKDSTNISLLALTLSDTGTLLSVLWMSLCYNPYLIDAFRHLDFNALQYLTGGWPNIIFNRTTSWLTAFITFERYLCISVPLKVKVILSPRRTTLAVVCIYTVMICGVLPVYFGMSLGSRFYAQRNRTVLTIRYTPDGAEIEKGSTTFNIIAQLTSFALVIICTIGLVQKFHQKIQWRNKSSTSTKNDAMSNRDNKLVKMIIWIAIVFIVAFLPAASSLIAMVIFEEFSFRGRERNIFIAVGSISFTTKTLNSTVNIFVYLNMSSKYKQTFISLFRCLQKDPQNNKKPKKETRKTGN